MKILRTHMPSGPLVVGCSDIMIGKSKEGTLIRIFYPTSSILSKEPNPKTWTRWFLGPEYGNGVGKYVAPAYFKGITGWLFNWQTRDALVPSVWCGDLLETKSKFPVIVFSHGLTAHRSFYSSVCCQLASHGFFVAALEHRDGSSSNSFILSDNGEKFHIEHQSVPEGSTDFSLRSKQIGVRIAESIRTLDVLERLNEGKKEGSPLRNELPSSFDLKQLQNKLDLSRPIMAGHSFGGGTTIGTLAKDQRFKLGIALDPWLFPLKDSVNDVCPKVKQPILCISTESFQTESNLAAMSKLPSENSSFVTIKGTVHQNQTDSPYILGTPGRYVGGAHSSLDYSLAMSINNALMLAFIDTHHGLVRELNEEFVVKEISVYLENVKRLLVPSLFGSGVKMLGWDGHVGISSY